MADTLFKKIQQTDGTYIYKTDRLRYNPNGRRPMLRVKGELFWTHAAKPSSFSDKGEPKYSSGCIIPQTAEDKALLLFIMESLFQKSKGDKAAIWAKKCFGHPAECFVRDVNVEYPDPALLDEKKLTLFENLKTEFVVKGSSNKDYPPSLRYRPPQLVGKSIELTPENYLELTGAAGGIGSTAILTLMPYCIENKIHAILKQITLIEPRKSEGNQDYDMETGEVLETISYDEWEAGQKAKDMAGNDPLDDEIPF